MPSRVIRDALLTSKSLRGVPLEVELTFVHLLLVVDDYGRFDADPDVLASALYPTRRAITPETVIGHVETLASCDDPVLVIYEAGDRRFLQLTGWEKHRAGTKRAVRSKYPEPPRIPMDPHGSPRIPRKSADPQPGEGEGEGIVNGSREAYAGGAGGNAPAPPSADEPTDLVEPDPPEAPPPKRAASPPTHDGLQLAEFFRDELAEHVEHARCPSNLAPWARTFDLMLRGTRDCEPIPRDHIETVIRFVVRDDFERANVQSADKLRKRFAALHAKATRGPAHVQRPGKLQQAHDAILRGIEAAERRAARPARPDDPPLRVVPFAG